MRSYADLDAGNEIRDKAVPGEAVAFLDDDREKIGRSADEAVIAMPGVSGECPQEPYGTLKKSGFERIPSCRAYRKSSMGIRGLYSYRYGSERPAFRQTGNRIGRRCYAEGVLQLSGFDRNEYEGRYGASGISAARGKKCDARFCKLGGN
jgi:hypothetical protein